MPEGVRVSNADLVDLPYDRRIDPLREVEFLTTPQQVNHRRYEALRAFFIDGLSHAEAGDRFGYTRSAMVCLVRDYRAGRLDRFAPARRPGPAPGTAPARERVRGRVTALRRQGLSV